MDIDTIMHPEHRRAYAKLDRATAKLAVTNGVLTKTQEELDRVAGMSEEEFQAEKAERADRQDASDLGDRISAFQAAGWELQAEAVR